MDTIYLDANSTTPIDPQVIDAMVDCWNKNFMNPASQHQPGQQARRELESIRSRIVKLLGGASGNHLIFTSGGTEANNLAIRGIALGQAGANSQNEIIISAIEHPSVIGAAEALKNSGFVVRQLPVNSSGVALVDQLDELISERTRLVSLMLANNETGVIQPVERAAQICRSRSVPLHSDAVQAIGKQRVNFVDLGVSAMTLTAHKIHGPRGIGGLLIDDSVTVQPVIYGGFQQLGLRPGTEDVSLEAGFLRAIEIADAGIDEIMPRIRRLRDRLEQLIREQCSQCQINGSDVERLPHTSNLSFPGVDRQALLMACDAAGVAISTGSACASGSSELSPVLIAMGLDSDVIESSIRVSLSRLTTQAEIDSAANRITRCVKHLRELKRP